MSFLRTGKSSKALAIKNQAEQELRKLQKGKAWRYFLEPKETGRLTFVDGDLDEDGELNPPRAYEHFDRETKTHFVCPQKTDPSLGDVCPTCERNGNNDWAALVAYFTVIDHRTIQSKDGKKSYTNERKLFVPKSEVMEKLTKRAIARGGLAGTTWDVSRGNDKTAATGDDFEFVAKADIAGLRKLYREDKLDDKGKVIGEQTAFYPINYDEDIVMMREAELRQKGFGTGANGKSTGVSSGYIPSTQKMADDTPPPDADELEQHL